MPTLHIYGLSEYIADNDEGISTIASNLAGT